MRKIKELSELDEYEQGFLDGITATAEMLGTPADGRASANGKLLKAIEEFHDETAEHLISVHKAKSGIKDDNNDQS